MSRLTDRKLIKDGIVGCVDNNKNKCNDNCIYGLCKWVRECLLKLKEYEDLEEQGLLLKLPCKVGDTYWELEKMFWVNEHKCKGCKFYFETLEDSFCDCDNDFPKCTQILEKKFSSIKEIVMNMDEINKTIFLTKEEAEKALERLECTE